MATNEEVWADTSSDPLSADGCLQPWVGSSRIEISMYACTPAS